MSQLRAVRRTVIVCAVLMLASVQAAAFEEPPPAEDALPKVKIVLSLNSSSGPAKPQSPTAPADDAEEVSRDNSDTQSWSAYPLSCLIPIMERNAEKRLLPKKPSIPEFPLVAQCLYGDDSDGQAQAAKSSRRTGELRPVDSQSNTLQLVPSNSGKGSITIADNTVTPKLTEPEDTATGSSTDNIPSLSTESIGEKRGEKHLSLKSEATPTKEFAADKAVNRDTSDNECPGAPNGDAPEVEAGPDDIPLEQEEHPYDAPAAKSSPVPTSKKSKVVANDFSAKELKIKLRINQTLAYYLEHPENTTRRGPWALMHTALPFGVESEIIAGNRRVNTIGWMCFNGVCAKQRMFQPTRQGFRTNTGPGVQGHEGQFLAILAQSKVQADYPIMIGRRKFTIQDLVKYEMATCRENSELTFKLIGLSHYLPQDQVWRDNRGKPWNLEKLVTEELKQPINGAACGGTHRLMALSFAVIKRQEAGYPITGNWERTEQYLNDYIAYAMSLQNPDGSFSTEWFESRGADRDVERQVQTTGHILEWLIFTLPDEHLRSARIQSSVEFLLNTVGNNPSRDWPIGPRGHVLRALSLYNQRVFGAEAGQQRAFIANAAQPRSVR